MSHAYELPAAILLGLSGLLACLAGFRLFKVILAIYGFALGAAIANSTMGATNTVGAIAIAIVGGIAGGVILVLAYYLGIALTGAGLGALVAHVGWNYFSSGDPPLVGVVALAVLGAIGALLLQRYVIILATAFGGAWIAILGFIGMRGDRALVTAAAGGDWSVLVPQPSGPGNEWIPAAWIVLGLIGTVVQLGITGRKS